MSGSCTAGFPGMLWRCCREDLPAKGKKFPIRKALLLFFLLLPPGFHLFSSNGQWERAGWGAMSSVFSISASQHALQSPSYETGNGSSSLIHLFAAEGNEMTHVLESFFSAFSPFYFPLHFLQLQESHWAGKETLWLWHFVTQRFPQHCCHSEAF